MSRLQVDLGTQFLLNRFLHLAAPHQDQIEIAATTSSLNSPSQPLHLHRQWPTQPRLNCFLTVSLKRPIFYLALPFLRMESDRSKCSRCCRGQMTPLDVRRQTAENSLFL